MAERSDNKKVTIALNMYYVYNTAETFSKKLS